MNKRVIQQSSHGLSSQITALRRALAQLDPECRRVLILKFFHRHSTHEVALLLHCSEAAVQQLQYRALAALQQYAA